MDIAYRLQELRKRSGLSQEQLAEKLNVPHQSLSSWESGQGYPDISNISKLSDVFGVSTDFLLKGIPERHTSASPPNPAPHTSSPARIAGAVLLVFGGLAVITVLLIVVLRFL